MESRRATRILVVTDHAEPGAALVEAMRQRTATENVQFRVVVPNPARAELHLLHPERHDKAAEAEQVLHEARRYLNAGQDERLHAALRLAIDRADRDDAVRLPERLAI